MANRKTVLTVAMDTKEAERKLESLQSLADDLRKRLELQEVKSNPAQVNKINDELKAVESSIESYKKGLQDVSDVISNLSGVTERTLLRTLQKQKMAFKNAMPGTPEYKQASLNIKAISDQLVRVRLGMTNWEDASKRINTLSEKELNILKETATELRRMEQPNTEGWNKYNDVVKQADGRLKEIGGTTRTTGSMFDNLGVSIKRIGAYALTYLGFNELIAGLRKMYDMNVLLSDQLADIEKTTGITGRELTELSNDINKINTRTSVEQLNNLAVVAGKIGIKGRENVLEFVKAGNQINVALGEDLGEEAIKNIAKLNDVLGITKELGVEKALLSTGSAINELGQNSTASEAYLVDFGKRLGGIASQAGITMQQILALGSVTDQLGQNVEVSATALNKFITSIVANTDKVANAIGVTADELRARLDKSTWEGLMFVLEKLNGKGGLAGLAPIMGDLGSDGARLTAVLSSLAQNYKMLGSEVDLSNKAFAEATSLTNETLKKESSLAGVVARISKNVSTAVQNSAFVEKFKELALYIENATSQFDDFGNKISGASNILITIVGWLTKLGVFLARNINIIAQLAFMFGSLKIAVAATSLATSAYTALTSAMTAVQVTATTVGKAFAIVFYTLTGNTQKATVAMAAFNAITKANPWVLAGTALLGLATAIYGIVRAAGQASREYKAFRVEMQKSIASEQAEAEYLFSVVRMTAEGTEKRKEAIEEINSKYGQYLPNLLTEKTTTEELATALRMVNDQLQNKVALEARETEKKEVIQTGITDQQQLFTEINKNINASDEMVARIDTKIKDITKKAMDRGLGIDDAARAVNGVVKKQFSNAVDFTASYYNNVYDYVKKVYDQEAKLKQINQKFTPFIKERDPNTVNSLAEGVTVTGTDQRKATNTESDKEAKKRLKSSLDAVDAYVDQEKSKLIQARVNRDKYRDEEIATEQKYNEMLEKIEFEGLEKKLAIAGLDKEKRAEVERQFYDLKLRLFNKAEADTKSYLDKLDKLYDDFELKGVSRDQRELIRIQQKFNDASLLLQDALKKGLISQEEYEKQLETIRGKGKEAEDTYYKDKASKEAEKQIKVLNQQQSADELTASENRLNGIYTEQEYKARLLEIEIEYQSKRLEVSGLTEEQITEIKRKNADRQTAILDAASRKQEQLQQSYSNIIKSSLEGVENAFANLASGSEDAMEQMKIALVDTAFDTLIQLADIWIKQLTISAAVSTAEGSMKEIGTKGLLGIATAALVAGAVTALLNVARAAIKSAIGGKPTSSSSTPTTGNRVVKTSGFSSGGYSGDGGVYEVKGFVHGGEYVIPKWMMSNPLVFDTAQVLENIRQTRSQANPLPRQGYAEGGPVQTNIPIAPAMDPEMRQIMCDTKDLLSYLKSNGVITKFNISHFNEENSRYEASRRRGTRKD